MELVPKAEFSIVTALLPRRGSRSPLLLPDPKSPKPTLTFSLPRSATGTLALLTRGLAGSFFDWCAAHGLELTTVRPFHVAAWIEDFPGSKPTVKQKLAAVRMLYDFLVVRQITPSNPAHAVRGPKYVVKKGKTPVWNREDAKTLVDSIPKDSVSGLRDLALIATMFYSFAPVSAVLKLKVDDYYHNGARRRLRLHEKGGKEHEMPVHHLLEQILNEYIVAAGLQSEQPLFQSVNSLGTAVTGRALNRYNAWAAIRKRAKAAGFLTPVGCHNWRATGITIYLENDGRLEHAQQMAGHESPRTTKLYDRAKDEITLSEVGANPVVTFEILRCVLRRAIPSSTLPTPTATAENRSVIHQRITQNKFQKREELVHPPATVVMLLTE
jgi:site-specific recombinase XerD